MLSWNFLEIFTTAYMAVPDDVIDQLNQFYGVFPELKVFMDFADFANFNKFILHA